MRRLLIATFFCNNLLNAIPCIPYTTETGICKEYQVLNRYLLEDTAEKVVYYRWDNTTPGSYDAIVDDPLLVIRTKLGGPSEEFDLMRSWSNTTRFSHFFYPASHNELDERLPDHLSIRDPEPQLGAPDIVFDHVTPEFALSDAKTTWQISDDRSFKRIIPNLYREQSVKTSIDALSNTFLNPGHVYYFRQKATGEEWSKPISFRVIKPEAIQSIYFEASEPLKITWKGEPNTRYWVFASNAIDFVPQIYSEEQLNGLDENGTISTGAVENLMTITEENEIVVDDSLCFYRIIAERRGAFSVPSSIIHVYSRDQVPQRTTLLPLEKNPKVIQRQLFPADQHKAQIAAVPKLLRATQRNTKPKHVPQEQWDAIQPWIMPVNHAARAALDRIFSKRRVLQDSDTLINAGFNNSIPGIGSQTIVTNHPKVDHYILKLYLDSQTGVSDWQSWIHRASGADQAREFIRVHKLFPYIVVPYKWIYPLPPKPRASPESEGKNFILVVDKMPVISKKESILRWYRDMNKDRLKAIYTITEELGLVNCSQANNLRWEHYLRIVLCDFERHHIWPTNIGNLAAWLRPEMQTYLNELITEQK